MKQIQSDIFTPFYFLPHRENFDYMITGNLFRTIVILYFLSTNLLLAKSLPDNSYKNSYGSGWSCNKGYYRSVNQCLEVKVPENGMLDYLGSGWSCEKGFYRSGEKCLKVEVPINGKLDYLGSG